MSDDLRTKTVDELQKMLEEAEAESHKAFVDKDRHGLARSDFWQLRDRCSVIKVALADKRRAQRRFK